MVDALLKTSKHKVTAITRADSTSSVPSGVTAAKVDYADQSSLVNALKGIDVLLITMAITAPPEQQTKLIEAAAEAGVPWILPNEWGIDGANHQLHKDVMLGEKVNYRNSIEKLGKSSWIGCCTGFWYEYSLSAGLEMYGFDFKNRSVTFIDDGKTRQNTSTWPQVGRAVAALLSLKVLPEDENDKSPTLSAYRNGWVYWASFLLSQRDMLESVLRVTGTKEEDWSITTQQHEQRYKSGVEELQKGNRMGFGRLLYTRVFYPNGDGDFEHSRGLANGVLGLPKEDLDEATRRAIKLVEEGKDLGNELARKSGI